VIAAPARQDLTILVADDDPGVRALATILLRRAGYRVLEATTGREALGAVQVHGEDVDAVLLDIMMPEMNGHEALGALREARPDLPVVFFSGFDGNEVAEHLAQASAYTSFMPKPFDNDALLAEIRRAIESRD
jgi:two-component system, cell cycle sensor histidine kinase and response regulator CckA